jgi:uncharacterized protein
MTAPNCPGASVTSHRSTKAVARERIFPGGSGWWFLGPGGVARLGPGHVTADGRLSPQAERQLRVQGMFTKSPHRIYSLTVLTSTDCNLGCGYCFQNTGQDTSGGSRPPRIVPARLRSESIADILSFAGRRMAEAGLDQLALLLFGGEPLLNPRACVELLIRAADYGLAWAAMTSNGALLTPLLARDLYALGLRNVQVTFDGDRADHDRIRTTRSGKATFDVIANNIAQVSQATPVHWTLRINISHHNQHGIDALIERLADWLNPVACTIAFARVGDIGIGYRNNLTHTSELASVFARWQRKSVDLGFQVPRPRAHEPCQICADKGGRYGAVISADGTLSSCLETAGRAEWTVGTVVDGYLPAAELDARWTACTASHQYAMDLTAPRDFQDRVDADLLDYLSATGRLGVEPYWC